MPARLPTLAAGARSAQVPIDALSVRCLAPPRLVKIGFARRSFARLRGVQRAWLLYGKVLDDTDDVENAGARRAVVAAFYKPVQEKRADRVELLPSEDQTQFERVMDWLGLQPVGWLFMTGPRPSASKYGGSVVLTGQEVVTAARLQHQHRQVLAGAHMGESGKREDCKQGDEDEPFTYSEFVTVCVEHGDTVEPRAYWYKTFMRRLRIENY